MKLSVIIPAYNEERTIRPLFEKIYDALLDFDYEVIFVDDGSKDRTLQEAKDAANDHVTVINLGRNMGKSNAIYTGFQNASGDILVTIDSDLQDDPQDIPTLLKEIENGFDLVCGWRVNRQTTMLKKVSSKVTNLLHSLIFGTRLHDVNCPLKVFKKECVEKILYFRHFHRLLVALIHLQGFNIAENKIVNHPRMHGESKYGFRNRLLPNIKTTIQVRLNYKKYLKL